MVKDAKEAEKTITAWLKEENAYKETKSPEGYQYHIAAEYKPGTGRMASIFQKEGSKDKVLISSGLTLDEGTRKLMASMDAGKRAKFLKRLRYGLLKMPGNFNIVMDGDTVSEVRLSNRIYYDGLTKDRFFRALEDDWKKFLMVTWHIKDGLTK